MDEVLGTHEVSVRSYVLSIPINWIMLNTWFNADGSYNSPLGIMAVFIFVATIFIKDVYG